MLKTDKYDDIITTLDERTHIQEDMNEIQAYIDFSNTWLYENKELSEREKEEAAIYIRAMKTNMSYFKRNILALWKMIDENLFEVEKKEEIKTSHVKKKGKDNMIIPFNTDDIIE